jgi:glyoxylase-like metal-dependent hydrolase (beta-lactamase superfamily II)
MSANVWMRCLKSRLLLAPLMMMTLAGFVTRGPSAARPGGAQEQKSGNSRVQVAHVQGNVYMVVEPDSNNITVQVGNQYIIVVDSGVPEYSDDVIAAIRSLSDLPIMFIANTSSDPDHIGGNAKLSQAGWTLPNADAGGTSRDPDLLAGIINKDRLGPGAVIVGHANTMARVLSSKLAGTDAITYGDEGSRLYSNEAVLFYHMPAAHTDGDTMVFFRDSEVLSVGELFSTIGYPVIEIEKGGNINGVIDALNEMISLMVPKENEEGGTYVIPGHGYICDRNDVVNYRDMLTIIRGRIQDMVKKGMSLEQVKAAKPSYDYDPVYGSTTGPWTTDKFVEAVYRNLTGLNAQQARKE